MKWLVLATAAALTACASQHTDEAALEQERLKAQANAVFETVEKHAQCAGFHRAHAELASGDKSKTTYYTTAATNAEIAATEIATKEMQKDLAVEMVTNIAETQAAEWAFAIKSQDKQQMVMAQTETCNALAPEQKAFARDIVRAKYGFKKE